MDTSESTSADAAKAAADERLALAEAERQAQVDLTTAQTDEELRAAEKLAAEAAADRSAAADELRRATGRRLSAASGVSPSSVQLEPSTEPRQRLADTVVVERPVARASGYAVPPAVDPNAPLFPAKARVMAGGAVQQAVPAEAIDGERRSVLITSRVLHDEVLYEAGAPAEVTRAQFIALRDAGATEGYWPGD
ncbi:hypothetical protein [Methylopila sp. 73B]|uniref:hypothetical protein n=1 Tax=Methylopila sp. 73B TaxID=1120792 RepID=UPI0003785B65|nr:hypothetical protein [Methylopila sp. 73B]